MALEKWPHLRNFAVVHGFVPKSHRGGHCPLFLKRRFEFKFEGVVVACTFQARRFREVINRSIVLRPVPSVKDGTASKMIADGHEKEDAQ